MAGVLAARSQTCDIGEIADGVGGDTGAFGGAGNGLAVYEAVLVGVVVIGRGIPEGE